MIEDFNDVKIKLEHPCEIHDYIAFENDKKVTASPFLKKWGNVELNEKVIEVDEENSVMIRSNQHKSSNKNSNVTAKDQQVGTLNSTYSTEDLSPFTPKFFHGHGQLKVATNTITVPLKEPQKTTRLPFTYSRKLFYGNK